jgi:erythritol transport system ATP-binding protein
LTTTPAPLLAAAGITRRFPGTTALAGVDFAVEPGMVHALIGENGAGKSTLVRILAGVDEPTSGELLWQGERVRFASPLDARRLGIDIIHQELQLFPELSIEENLFVGRERTTRWGTIDRGAQRAAAQAVLHRLGLPTVAPRAKVGSLPLGQQQIVEIARAVVHDTRVLMMDEPTSALTASEIPTLFNLIRDLTSHGVGVVYISHRLDELLEVADTVTVLRDGAVVGHALRRDVSVGWIVQRMTGREAAAIDPSPRVIAKEPLLAVKDLAVPAAPGRTGLRDVTFDVRPGEILGLYGLMGAGRTELMECVLGVHADATGSVRLDGSELGGMDVRDRIARGISMVPEDRQTSGLVSTMNVRENMTLAHLDALSSAGYLSPAREERMAKEWATRLHVKAPALDAPIATLSGGNQQKVVIARSVMTRPRVLLMDEPTRGVDVGAKREIVDTMRRLAADGMAIVFATSELAEMHAAADRALVLARGQVAAEFAAPAMTDEALASAASASGTRAHRTKVDE